MSHPTPIELRILKKSGDSNEALLAQSNAQLTHYNAKPICKPASALTSHWHSWRQRTSVTHWDQCPKPYTAECITIRLSAHHYSAHRAVIQNITPEELY